MGRSGGHQNANHKLVSSAHGYLPPSASVKSSSSGAGMDALCNVAAAAEGNEELTFQPVKQMVDVEAFSSIHDMIHAAILQFGPPASLRQIYAACQERGRIAYKRAGGSRLITDNHNWKSQIRHALYTSGRFKRVAENKDEWVVTGNLSNQDPSMTMVTIFADDIGASGSVCGDASHVGTIPDADGTGNGLQVTSQAGMRTRGGRDGNSGALCAVAAGKISTPRSTRSKRSRTPSEKYRSVNISAQRSTEAASRDASKEGTAADFDEESESFAGQSFGGGEPSSMAYARSGLPRIAPHTSNNGTVDRRMLRSHLGKQTAHVESTEGGAETAGPEAGHSERKQPIDISCSFSAFRTPANAIPETTATSGRSVDTDMLHTKRSMEDISVSQGYLPMKKRLKAAAAESGPKVQAEQIMETSHSGMKLGSVNVGMETQPTGVVQDDAGKGASKRNPNRNRRKPFRGSTPGPTPSSPTASEYQEAAKLQQARSSRGQRGKPPKPGQTPGVTLRAKHPPSTPQVDTPNVEAALHLPEATPTTEPTPAPGIGTRMSRRMSMQKSPAASGDQVGTGSQGKPDRNEVKAAALAALQDIMRPMSMKEIADVVLERGLMRGGLGRTPDHAVASTLYLDIELCAMSPFCQEDDGKFGLVEWGGADT